jgi:DNA polymerase-1
VCLIGWGKEVVKMMLVVDAPGFREDDTGKPFSGNTGRLLDDTLEAVGFTREDFYITYAAKCHPPENRAPSRGEIKSCKQYLDQEIERLAPDFILTMGNGALNAVTKKSGIMKHRGNIYEVDGIRVFPTIAPGAVIRNPRNKGLWETDWNTFARIVKGEAGATPTKTYLVMDKRMLKLCVESIMKTKAVAYDLETNGFEEYVDDAKIATISVSPSPGMAFVVPVHHPEAPWKDADSVLRLITAALAYTSAKRIAHNAKFDDKWLTHFGNPVYADFDTMIAAHVIDENRPKGLKVLAPMYLGVDPWADVDLANGGAMAEGLKKLAKYNGKDSDYTLRLYYAMKEQLKAEGMERSARLFMKLMMPSSRSLTDIEMLGVWVDQKRLAERLIEVNKILEKLDKQLTKQFGQQANWNSTQVLAELLFDKLKLPVIEMTGKGAPSTKESVLLRLRAKHPVAQLLLDWRMWSKRQSTYLSRWGEMIDSDGRIHANYKVTGTVTGRLSSGKEEGNKGRGLNMQQVPREPLIRGILGSPPGWKFVEADFSQAELRIAAHYSGDPTLQRLYQLGQDVHMATAMDLTGKPEKSITKEERKKAKGVNFGFLFGMGWRKFVDYARDSYDVEVSENEAKLYRDRFFEKYDHLPRWHDRQRRLARQYKRVQSLIGRVRHLPDVDSPDKEVQAEAERQAINSPVQSLASDLMLMAMNELHEKMDPKEARIVGTVHDSLLMEVREDSVDKWVPIIRHTMENPPLKKKFGVELDVPIVVDITVGTHWSEGEEVA